MKNHGSEKAGIASYKHLKIENVYSINLLKIRAEEFKNLHGITYVDHAATTLYSDKQLEAIFASLNSAIFGNPHSRHLPSDAVTQLIDSSRSRILEHFNTSSEEYDVIFTSGATDAIKIVAECFCWCEKLHDSISQNSDHGVHKRHNGFFIYTQENHTSVLGIRESASRKGTKVFCYLANQIQKILDDHGESSVPASEDRDDDEVSDIGLFAYPGQCNYSGSKYPLDWIEKVHKGHLVGALKHFPLNASKDQTTITPAVKWFVLLDAASLVATSPLDLSVWKPDFVPVSFYKIFGYPTGLGCLLVNKRARNYLQKDYFGGGTVRIADSRTMVVSRRSTLHERFEDGTLPFLNILALEHGFNTLRRITGTMEYIGEHVFNVACYLYAKLRSLKHCNGRPVVEIYSESDDWTMSTQGPIVNFNVLDSSGNYIGYTHVERVASLYNIYLRTGCVCNPGACQKYLRISSEKLLQQFDAGHICGDTVDIVDGHPTGSVRVSFGYMSTYDDADMVLQMIMDCFIESPVVFSECQEYSIYTNETDEKYSSQVAVKPSSVTKELFALGHTYTGGLELIEQVAELEADSKDKSYLSTSCITDHLNSDCSNEEGLQELMIKKTSINEIELETDPSFSNGHEICTLTDIIIYPVKSCAGISAARWNIGSYGLEYDRHWMIVTSTGVTLTQKRAPKLSLIKPLIDFENDLLELSFQGYSSVKIKLNEAAEGGEILQETTLCGGRVCGDRVRGYDCGDTVGEWLSTVLAMNNLRLMRQIKGRKNRFSSSDNKVENLSLANESQYLIINMCSVRHLLKQIGQRGLETCLTEEALKLRFRPNLVVDGTVPYEEDQWDILSIGDLRFKVHGSCIRCQMVSVTPDTGERTREPLLTLAATRGTNMNFGIHASYIEEQSLPTNCPFLCTDKTVCVKVRAQ